MCAGGVPSRIKDQCSRINHSPLNISSYQKAQAWSPLWLPYIPKCFLFGLLISGWSQMICKMTCLSCLLHTMGRGEQIGTKSGFWTLERGLYCCHVLVCWDVTQFVFSFSWLDKVREWIYKALSRFSFGSVFAIQDEAILHFEGMVDVVRVGRASLFFLILLLLKHEWYLKPESRKRMG